MTDKPMTVGDVIKKLQEFDTKLPVYTPGYDEIYAGLSNIKFSHIKKHDCLCECGEIAEADDPASIKACVIETAIA